MKHNNTFDLIVGDINFILAEFHKPRCFSDEHREEISKDTLGLYDHFCGEELAQSIISLLQHSTCKHCGYAHTGRDAREDGSAFAYENLLMHLFEAVARELLQRKANLKHSCWGKNDLLEAVRGINPQKKVRSA